MGKKTDLESVHLVNHSKCMLANFQNFRQDETMLDVTLACDGHKLKAHKLILSAFSPFFKDLFAENPCTHPIIILRNFEFADLKAIIDFLYKGELSVPRERLLSALKVAEELQIRGLRRSGSSTEKFEKLYNQVRDKLSSKKKRKRRRHNSSDSDEKEYLNVSESDENIVVSDENLSAHDNTILESQPMDMETSVQEENSIDKEFRPLVLRVGDRVASDDSNSNNILEGKESNAIDSVEQELSHIDSQKESSSCKEIEDPSFDSVHENIESSSQLESFVACSETENSLLDSVPTDEQNSFQDSQNIVTMGIASCSKEQDDISLITLSTESLEGQQNDEKIIHDEGKSFVCSKCSCVFTSRINFMRHKMLGHNKTDKRSPYKCQHCTFSTDEPDCLKTHLLTHVKVPYKCNICSEEFSSEEQGEQHMSVHEETVLQSDISTVSGQDLLPVQSNVQENVVFRCSVCFTKFTSKLCCQIHEKTCTGGS